MVNEQVEILLVEDDPSDLHLALHALREARVCNRIHIARDGEEALDFLFCEGPFAGRDPESRLKMVLLDLKVPKVGGHEVLRRMREMERTRTLPVIVLTSSRQEEDLIRSYELGANSYIQKPVDFDQFQDVIKHLGYYWLLVNKSPTEGKMADTYNDLARSS